MTTDFSNSVILPENLPSIQVASFTPIDRKYIKIIYFQYLVTLVVLILIGVAIAVLSTKKLAGYVPWIIAVAVIVVFCYSLIISRLSFPRRGYLIREKDIAYQRGLITYKLTSIPFNRIQHVELNQGILAKKMGLASLKIFTAGGSADDLEIHGLPVEVAKQIREFLTGKISSDDQD